MHNQRWGPRNGCDNSSKAKIIVITIQVNLCAFLQVPLGLGTNSLELIFFSIHSHFLAATFDWLAFWGPHTFSLIGCFCIDMHIHNTPQCPA